MNRAIRCTSLLFSLFLMLIAVSASFSQKVVISDKLPDDPRLDKPVTLRVWKAQLTDVLSQVSLQTGVKIEADSGKRFWSVRQRKVSIIVKEMKLRDFLTQLEKLLGYNIRHTGTEGNYVYTFWQDLHARTIEQELLETQKDAKVKYRERALYDTLSDAERALSLSPAEIELAKKSDPWVAYLASDPEARQFATLLTSISQEQYDKLLKELNIYCPIKTLSDKAQNAVQELGRINADGQLAKQWKEHYGDSTLDSISIYQNRQDQDKTDPGYAFNVNILAKPNDVSKPGYANTVLPMAYFIIAPRDSENSLRTAARFKFKSEGLSDFEVNRKINEVLSKGKAEGLSVVESLSGLVGRPVSPKATSKEKTDPDLEKTVKLSIDLSKRKAEYIGRLNYAGYTLKSDRLQPMFESIADGTGLNIMYESFSLPENVPPTFEQEQKLSTLLDNMAGNNQLDWIKDGNTIRFRAKDWAERRSWEFPNEWREKWYASLKAKYELSWDELVEIAMSLNDDQINHSLVAPYDADLNYFDDPDQAVVFQIAAGLTLRDMASVLRFCGGLSQSQNDKLWSKEGLNMDEIPQHQLPDVCGMSWFKDQSIDIYDVVFFAKHNQISGTDGQSTYIGAKMKVWYKDLPKEMQKQLIANAKFHNKNGDEIAPSADDIDRFTNTPTELNFGTSFDESGSKDEVKKMLDVIEQKKKEKEQKQ